MTSIAEGSNSIHCKLDPTDTSGGVLRLRGSSVPYVQARGSDFGQLSAPDRNSIRFRHGSQASAVTVLSRDIAGSDIRIRLPKGTGGPRPFTTYYRHMEPRWFCQVGYELPVITGVTLSGSSTFSLAAAGGQTLQIAGREFGMDTTATSDGTVAASKAHVLLGDRPCASVIRDSTTSLRCVTAAGVGGPFRVKVTVDGQTTAQTNFRVSYNAITISAV